MKTRRTFQDCPKCGQSDPKPVWRSDRLENCPYVAAPHHREHFDVTCSRCGFTWAEPIEQPEGER